MSQQFDLPADEAFASLWPWHPRAWSVLYRVGNLYHSNSDRATGTGLEQPLTTSDLTVIRLDVAWHSSSQRVQVDKNRNLKESWIGSMAFHVGLPVNSGFRTTKRPERKALPLRTKLLCSDRSSLP